MAIAMKHSMGTATCQLFDRYASYPKKQPGETAYADSQGKGKTKGNGLAFKAIQSNLLQPAVLCAPN